MEVEKHEADGFAVLQEDGSWLYNGPNGRLETWEQRCARLEHNQKMQFHRSFRTLLKYHDHGIFFWFKP